MQKPCLSLSLGFFTCMHDLFSTSNPTLPIVTWPNFQELTFLEFFAGEGNVWKAMRADSLAAIGIDILYDNADPGNQNPFDILSHAGMAWES